MNSAPITSPAVCGVSRSLCSWNVTSTVNANLNKLSLPAPRNWVQKNGAKRRSRSSWNWLCSAIVAPWSGMSDLAAQ